MACKLPEFTDGEIEFSRAQTEYTERKIMERFGQDRAENFFAFIGFWAGLVISFISLALGRVDKRDSHQALIMIQAGICDGGQFGTSPYVGRGMGVL